jgi:probable addiction module antidote protein
VSPGESEIRAFDASAYLDDEEVIAECLDAALDDPNPRVFLRAVANVAKASGIAKVAADAGVGRESLYKAPFVVLTLIQNCRSVFARFRGPISR